MRRILGWYQLIGGVVGLVVMLVLPLLGGRRPDGLVLLLCLPFLLVIWAGLALLQGRPAGAPLTVAVQLPQAVFFALGGYAYHFGAGLFLGEWMAQRMLRFRAGFDLSLQWAWGQADIPPLFGVNVVPLVVLALLWQVSRSSRKRREASTDLAVEAA